VGGQGCEKCFLRLGLYDNQANLAYNYGVGQQEIATKTEMEGMGLHPTVD